MWCIDGITIRSRAHYNMSRCVRERVNWDTHWANESQAIWYISNWITVIFEMDRWERMDDRLYVQGGRKKQK